MDVQFSQEEIMDLSLSYLDATAYICQVTCSIEDPEVDDKYIRNCLYSALYALSYFLIARLKRTPPESLENRLHRVRDLYGVHYVPYECGKLVQRDLPLYRDELAVIGQAMDCWAVQQYTKYGDIVQSQSVDHSYVLCAG